MKIKIVDRKARILKHFCKNKNYGRTFPRKNLFVTNYARFRLVQAGVRRGRYNKFLIILYATKKIGFTHYARFGLVQAGVRRGRYKLVWGGPSMLKKEDSQWGRSHSAKYPFFYSSFSSNHPSAKSLDSAAGFRLNMFN